MKLHLPKALFTAVMALFAISQTTWADWESGYGDYTDGYVYYLNDNANIDAVNNAADYTKLYIQKGDLTAAEVEQLSVKSGDTVVFSANTSSDGAGNLSGLTIGTLDIAGAGTANVDVRADQVVGIEAISGTISNLQVGGTLTIGTQGDKTSTYTLERGNIAEGGKLTLAGGVTTIGASSGAQTFTPSGGELVVNADATLKFAKTDVLKWGTNKITLDGGTWEGGSTRQSIGNGTVINLIGGTITGGDESAALEIADNNVQLKSSGQSSISSIALSWNRTLTIEVLADTLTVGYIFNKEYDGGNQKGNITKKGDGTLKLTSLAKRASGVITLESGALEFAIDKTSEESTQDGTYDGTISGKGNLVKSGTGTVTVTTVSNLDGEISVTGGALNITSLAADKTVDVDVTDGTLSITNVTVDVESWVANSSDIKYYIYVDGQEQESSTGNGFYANASTYKLFDGYEWNGAIEGYTKSFQDGDTYLTASGEITGEYHINTGTETVNHASVQADSYMVKGGTLNITGTMNSSDIEYTSGAITLADANATLVLDGSTNAAQLLALTTGNGNITIAENVTMSGGSSSQATGKLTINNNKTLQVGNGNTDASNISSFTSIELAGGTLFLRGKGEDIYSLSTKDAKSTLKVSNWGASIQTYTLKGTTTLNADLDITTENNEKGKVVIETLTGTKNLSVTGGGQWGPAAVTINALEAYSGVISVDGGNRAEANLNSITFGKIDSDITIGGLTVTNKGKVDFSAVTGTKNLGTVTVDANTVLNLQGSIGTMTAGGEGTIALAAGTQLTGTKTIANAVTLGGTVTNTGTTTISGVISDAADATGKLVVSQGSVTINSSNNTYSGGTEVKGGATLLVGNQTNGALGTGAVDVSEKSTLKLGWLSSLKVDTINLSGESTIDLQNASSREITSTNDLNAAITVEGSNTIKAGINGDNTAVNGTISGNGTLLLDNQNQSNTWLLQSTISDKQDGKLAISSNSDAIVSGSNTYTGGTEITGRTLTTASESALGTGTVTVKGGTLKQDAALVVTALDYRSGTVNNNGQNLKVGALTVGSTKLEMQGDGATTVTQTLTVSNTDAFTMQGALVLADAAKVDLSGFTLDTTTSQDTYVYTLGTANGGISAKDVSNISFTGLKGYDGYTATLAALAAAPSTSSVMLLDGAATNNYLVLTLTKDTPAVEPTTLTEFNITGGTYADGVLTFTTDVEDVTAMVFDANGVNAVMDDDTWNEILAASTLPEEIKVSFKDKADNVFDFNGAGDDLTAPTTITINGEPGVGANGATVSADGTVVGNYVTAYIPEPTSTTLSLLALAALAVRRRRK